MISNISSARVSYKQHQVVTQELYLPAREQFFKLGIRNTDIDRHQIKIP